MDKIMILDKRLQSLLSKVESEHYMLPNKEHQLNQYEDETVVKTGIGASILAGCSLIGIHPPAEILYKKISSFILNNFGKIRLYDIDQAFELYALDNLPTKVFYPKDSTFNIKFFNELMASYSKYKEKIDASIKRKKDILDNKPYNELISNRIKNDAHIKLILNELYNKVCDSVDINIHSVSPALYDYVNSVSRTYFEIYKNPLRVSSFLDYISVEEKNNILNKVKTEYHLIDNTQLIGSGATHQEKIMNTAKKYALISLLEKIKNKQVRNVNAMEFLENVCFINLNSYIEFSKAKTDRNNLLSRNT